MLTATKRLIEFPQLPPNAVPVLKQVFDLTLIEYAMLAACERDDITKFACDPRTVHGWGKSKALQALSQRKMIYLDQATGKWELLSSGRSILAIIPLVVTNLNAVTTEPSGKLLDWPKVSA